MNEEKLYERDFEADIEQWLLEKGGYTKGNQRTYDTNRAIDMTTLISFIEASQPKEWKRFKQRYGEQAENRLYNDFQDSVKENGLIYTLRKGIKNMGIPIKFCFFCPPSELNADLMRKYNQNVLQVVRQFAYSKEIRNTIDMVLMLNGIPIVAMELKNQIKRQDVEKSRKQWMENRDPAEFLFHFNNRILVYFGIDLYEAIMTTELKGEKTRFVPFNQGSEGAGNVGGAGNPNTEADDEYITSYIWYNVLRKDMLMSILQRYISCQKETKLKIIRNNQNQIVETSEDSVKIVFPRYHQLDVVEKLISDTENRGSGHNYLIQHSAGSGKSNSIAWLTYRLASLHNTDQKPIFDGVFVIVDRRVLNKQLQDTILSFDHVDGQVVTVTDKDDSSKLLNAIKDEKRIIICTLHRFPVIYKKVGSRSGKHYAIVVDEAHSSQSGKSTETMKVALADTDEALREMAEIEEKTEEELEKERDGMLEDLLAQGQHDNLSFYAFTATPKPKTLQTFGELVEKGPTPDKDKFAPYHIYSMLQAIEEGFIMDVLLQYTPYTVSFEIKKSIAADPTYEETPATRAVIAYKEQHQHSINEKTAIIVEQFREITLNAMNGQAKAMVVTSSRAHALRYFMQIKKYCQEKKYTDVHPLVAFSGKVKYGEKEYTEPSLNKLDDKKISEEKLPLYFASDMFNMLVVADKYQTGFDEPLLHTMFVDKKLKKVKAVQTLSRLNRSHPDKKDTFVLDFVNNADSIKKSFEPFYTNTELIRPVDVNGIYKFHNEISKLHLWSTEEEEKVCDIVLKEKDKEKRLARLSNALKPIANRFDDLDEDKQYCVRSLIKNFIRFYAYMAQVERTFDRELYKSYVFCSFLIRVLKTRGHQALNLSSQIELYNYHIEPGKTQKITLDKGKGGIKGENVKGGGFIDNKEDFLSNIIDKINQMYKGPFTEADRVIISFIYDKLNSTATKKKLSKQAINNDERQFTESIFPEVFDKAAQQCLSEYDSAFERLFQNKELYQSIMRYMAEMWYTNLKAQGEEIIFNPERFKEKIVGIMDAEFAPKKGKMKTYEQTAKDLVDVIAAKTIDDIDGANDVIQNAFNHLYCSPTAVPFLDKKQHFNTLVSRFEVFLKKVYYLNEQKEIISTKPGNEGASATLADCIYQTECLKKLKFSDDEFDKKFSSYLKMVRDWRNEQTHKAPISTEQECDAAIKVVTNMYLFVVAFGISTFTIEANMPKANEIGLKPKDYDKAAEPVGEN